MRRFTLTQKLIPVAFVFIILSTCKKKEFIPTPCDRDSFVIAGLITKCMYYNDFDPDIDSVVLFEPGELGYYSLDLNKDNFVDFIVTSQIVSGNILISSYIIDPSD